MVLQWYMGFRVSQNSEYLFGGTPIKRVLGFYVGVPYFRENLPRVGMVATPSVL